MLDTTVVERCEDERIDALVAGDVGRLDGLFSDRMLWFHASGARDTKESFLSSLEEGRMRCHALEPGGRTIRIFDNVAIVVGEWTMDVEVAGNRRRSHHAFTAVWRLEAGSLRLLGVHSSRLDA
jgi:hypothetical protein